MERRGLPVSERPQIGGRSRAERAERRLWLGWFLYLAMLVAFGLLVSAAAEVVRWVS